jgi:hypothetical protein
MTPFKLMIDGELYEVHPYRVTHLASGDAYWFDSWQAFCEYVTWMLNLVW